MEAFSRLIGLTGRWRGTYRLTVDPAEPARESQSTAIVAPVAGGRFARIDYAWGDRDKPQDGSILFGRDRTRGVVTALWVDSWHMSDKVMTCAKAWRRAAIRSTCGVPTPRRLVRTGDGAP
jgi:hypothetical protein